MTKQFKESQATENFRQAVDNFLLCFKLIFAVGFSFELVKIVHFGAILKNPALLQSWV